MKKLSKQAYGGIKGENYIQYVEDGKTRKAINTIILIRGCILATMFADSTVYSEMKADLTFATGIPEAMIGSEIVSLFAREKGILEKNQGMSSDGKSIVSGSIYVLPSIILIGAHVDFLTGIIIGAMAVFFSIGIASLVENYLIIQEHGKIMYLESMAISESLVASETGGESLKMMGIGFGIGGIFTAITNQFFGWMNQVISLKSYTFYKWNYKWKFSTEVNLLLAGIGFVVGPNVAGSILANFAVVPFTSMADSSATSMFSLLVAIAGIFVMGIIISKSFLMFLIGAGLALGVYLPISTTSIILV